MSVCFLSSNFFLSNQEFMIEYCSGYVKLYAVIDRQLHFISECKDSEAAKERAKSYMGVLSIKLHKDYNVKFLYGTTEFYLFMWLLWLDLP